VIARYEHHPSTTLGMTQDPAYHIGMTLPPTPLVLLYLPSVYDIAYQVQGVAGVMFEEVVEPICLAVSGAEMHVGYEYASVGMRHHTNI
jgi:hypothetical protein